ncbi:MAG: hypothetical protein WAU32_10885 [Thermoanaerobaculia bacterium]
MAARGLWIGLLLAAGTPAVLAAPRSISADAYVLCRGAETSISGSLDDLDRLRRRFPGDFLWFRRSGTEYVIWEPGLLSEAEDLFSPLHALGAEQEALSRREESLDREEEALDAEREEIQAEREEPSVADTGAENADATATAPEDDLDERERSVEGRLRELKARQRSLESEERELDAREEAVESEAEANLWLLLDHGVEDGKAERLPRR